MTNEKQHIYSLFLSGNVERLKDFTGERKVTLNLADVTEPLDLRIDETTDDCLHGIKMEHPSQSQNEVHRLEALSLPDGVRMVGKGEQRSIKPYIVGKKGSPRDRKGQILSANILTVSEIAFDSAHQVAFLRYTFECGNLCGAGALIRFQDSMNGCKESVHDCGS